MGFADEAAQYARSPGSKCETGKALVAMDDALRAEVIEALRSPLSGNSIAVALRNRGFAEVRDQTVNRHRARKCKCPDDLR